MSTRDPELTRLLTMELERHLVALEENAGKRDEAALESTRRTVHALKGSAGLAGEPELASAMQRLERRLREGEHTALEDIVETVKRAIRRLSKGETAIDQAWPEPPPDLVPNALEPLLRSQYVAEVVDRLAQIDDALGSTIDPVDAASAVYRHVHTMKGAASAAGDEPMAWFCHGLEERLRNGSSSRDAATAALNEVAKYRAVLGGLRADAQQGRGPVSFPGHRGRWRSRMGERASADRCLARSSPNHVHGRALPAWRRSPSQTGVL